MKVSLLSIPATYHLGSLNPAQRGPFSYEGNGLSVSLQPEAWQSISKLGGRPLHEIRKPGSSFLDVHALDHEARAAILDWAVARGLVEKAVRWCDWKWDTEAEVWRCGWNESREQAIAEAIEAWECEDEYGLRVAYDDLTEQQRAGLPAGVGLVHRGEIALLTEAGRSRAPGFPAPADAWDMAVMFWIEDELRAAFPEVIGAWWSEDLDPENDSAPRGAILSDCLVGCETRELTWEDYWDRDHDHEIESRVEEWVGAALGLAR